MKCRSCKSSDFLTFCDLHTCPPSNDMLSQVQLDQSETFYPLKVFVCKRCFLVQIDEVKKAEMLFNEDYTYFSSYSTSWLNHANNYAEYIVKRLSLNENSFVVEIASNDGYLLQYFKQRGIPVLGIEPTANTASVAIEKNINTLIEFFSSNLVQNHKLTKKADLIIGNNVLAHVPNIIDIVNGIREILKDDGIGTFEFPYLLNLVEEVQFDTIYHEHFSYFSLYAIKKIMNDAGLDIFDVQRLKTHGGSIRIFVKKAINNSITISSNVGELLNKEKALGIDTPNYYLDFQIKVDKIKFDFLQFLIESKLSNKKVIGYGAAAKGNTLLNYSGVNGTDLISFVVDKSPHKIGKFLPGSRIPVKSLDQITEFRPDIIIVFPWNLSNEISQELSFVRSWGARLFRFVPEIREIV